MTTLGTLGTAHTLECNRLIVNDLQEEVKTEKILLRNGQDTLWSIGYDNDNNFVLTNELLDPPVVSIEASIDTGNVNIRGGGSGGATTLDGLTDVDTAGVQNGEMMYRDGTTATYKFSDKIQIQDTQSRVGFFTDIAMNDQDIIDVKDIKFQMGNTENSIQSPGMLELRSDYNGSTSNFIGLNGNTIAAYPFSGSSEVDINVASNLDFNNLNDIKNVRDISISRDIINVRDISISRDIINVRDISNVRDIYVGQIFASQNMVSPFFSSDVAVSFFSNRANLTLNYVEFSSNEVQGVLPNGTYTHLKIPDLRSQQITTDQLNVGSLDILTINMPEIQTPLFFHIRANSTNYIEFSGDRLRASDTNMNTIPLRIEGNVTVNGNVTANNIGAPDFGRYRITGMFVPNSQTLNVILTTTGTQRGITLNGTTGIVTSSAGTYRITWNFNVQQSTASNGSFQLNLFQNNVFQYTQKIQLINFDNMSGSYVFEQTAATAVYSFNIGQGNVSFNLLGGSAHTEVTIQKLF